MRLHNRDAPKSVAISDRDHRSAISNYIWFIRRQPVGVADYSPLAEALTDATMAACAALDQKGGFLQIEIGFEVPEGLLVNGLSLREGVLDLISKLDPDQCRERSFTLVADLDVYPSSTVLLFSLYVDDDTFPKRNWTYGGSANVLQRVLEYNFIQRRRERYFA